MNQRIILGLFVATVSNSDALFYLPGVAPRSYNPRDNVPVLVNKLTSTHTQIPYDYYSLPFCHPHIHEESENLGERLSGDRIENSLYKVQMKRPQACEIVCRKVMTKFQSKTFVEAIDNEYRVHWLVDNLPSSTVVVNELAPDEPYFTRGFPVGFKAADFETGKEMHYLYNHIRIIISYNEDHNPEVAERKFEGARIVGFRVEPFSIHHRWDDHGGAEFDKQFTMLKTCNEMTHAVNDPANYMSVDHATEVIFTYDVVFEESDVAWANRWDVYLRGNPDDKIHWFSITNSTMIVIFLTVMVAMIMVRTLSSDIAQYNLDSSVEESKEESGWKLVHADVFRAPANGKMFFAVLAGTGMQLLAMVFITLIFALLGFLSPANRGSLLTVLLLLYVILGSVAGYYSSRVFKFFKGEDWMRATLFTAFLFPGFIFSLFMILNAALLYEGSSGAIPLSTFVTLIVLWFGVSTPLVFTGSYFGYKKPAYTPPVRVNLIPRQVPPQPWYMSWWVTIVFGGVLPFGAVSVELFFIMSALWLHQIYYIFGFLFLVMLILVATCAETTILMCYFQLCNEDYRWWWRSMFASGSCAGYIFIYAIWYFIVELEIEGLVPGMLYFGYMGMISLAFFILTASIGFYSCFWFVSKIYGSIKVD
jgi:transmembrane 9 superfamily protein 2/4